MKLTWIIKCECENPINQLVLLAVCHNIQFFPVWRKMVHQSHMTGDVYGLSQSTCGRVQAALFNVYSYCALLISW